MGRDQPQALVSPGAEGLPSLDRARAVSCTPGDGSTRCAFGSGRPRPCVCSPCYCHPLLLSLLGTFNEQPGPGRRTALLTLSSPDNGKTAGCPISIHPILGRMCSHAPSPRCSGPPQGSGDGREPGWLPEQNHAWGRGLGSVAWRCPPGSILPAEQPPCPVPSPAVPIVAGRAGMWWRGGWRCPGPARPPFLLAPDVCQGLPGQAPRRGGPGRVSALGLAAWQCRGGRAPCGALGWAPRSQAGVSPEKWV